MPQETFHWLDVRRIGEELAEHYPAIDPMTVSFPRLRDLVKGLPGFEPQADHPSNERILEAIQQAWIEEREA